MKVSEAFMSSLSQNQTYLWRFDQSQNIWVLAYSKCITTSKVQGGYYTSKVKLTGWHNLDKYIVSTTHIRKQIVSDSRVAAYTQIYFYGVNFNGVQTAWTD